MPQSANFSVQNALKLTYKHPEIPKKFLGSLSLATKGTKGQGRGGGKGRGGTEGGEGRGGEGRGGEGRGTGGEGRGVEGRGGDPDPQVF
jgi:hypothetical protein